MPPSQHCCIDENESLCSRRLYPIRMNSSHITALTERLMRVLDVYVGRVRVIQHMCVFERGSNIVGRELVRPDPGRPTAPAPKVNYKA